MTRLRELIGDCYHLGVYFGSPVFLAFLKMLPEVAGRGTSGGNFSAVAGEFYVATNVEASNALAVIAHKFPRGIPASITMLGSGYRKRGVLGALMVDPLFTPIGALLVLPGLFPEQLFAPLLGFATGTFIYAGASDLLPEAHRSCNLRVILSVFLGLGLILLLEKLIG